MIINLIILIKIYNWEVKYVDFDYKFVLVFGTPPKYLKRVF